ncbi:DUF7169 domain-containing protein [Micromonospora nigra]|uniref:DUF7169 domain-containing protein n=1 Tax=Micromonospora nigra TaxID=145857 RepID=UPI000B809FEE
MTPAELDTDRDAVRMADLVSRLRDELDALTSVLPAAIDAQWTAAPVARPRDDTSERMKNTRSDPTAAVVLDPDRLRLREQVVRSARVLHGGTIALREARRALVDALAPWDGEDTGNG